MAKLDESSLKALLDAEIWNALGYVGKLSEARRKALYYYYAEAKEDLSPPEVDGRSSAVSTDLSDVVEWVMPSLMKIFAAGDEVVQFSPRKQGDEDAAEQMTHLCNYIWQRNGGFKVYHNWFKDALLEKLGIVKIWYDKKTEQKREEYEGLTDIQLGMLAQDDAVEIIEHTAIPGPVDPMTQQPTMLHCVTLLRDKPRNEIVVENVPPEEFLVSRRAKSIDDAPFICHRTPKSQSDLIAMGYPQSVIDNLSTDERWGEFNAERIERIVKDDEMPWSYMGQQSPDRSQRYFWVAECYLKIDWDGDGIAELRKITKIGTTILENEEIDCYPFAVLTPILMPHRLFGRSMYDIVGPVQKIKTAVLRGGLDSIYLSTNPRTVAVEGQVNLDDLLASRPGGVVRAKSIDAVQALVSPPVHDGAFQALQYLDDWRENITGVTKYNQGTDSNSLNKTATGMTAIMQASNQRIELIARVFAETGVADAFKLIQKLLMQHQKEPMVLRVSGEFANIDPRVWANEYDMTVATALGAGTREQQLQTLMNILNIQTQAVQGGMLPAALAPKYLLHTAGKIVEASGFKDTENFFPSEQDIQQAQQQSPPQQPPEVQAAQAQGQALIQKTQIEQQGKQAEIAAKSASEEKKMTLDAQFKQWQAEQDAQLERWKAQLEAETKVKIEAFKEQLIHEREMMKIQTPPPSTTVQIGDKEVAGHIQQHMMQNHDALANALTQMAGAHAAVADAVNGLREAQSRPKMIVRDKTGRAVSVQ